MTTAEIIPGRSYQKVYSVPVDSNGNIIEPSQVSGYAISDRQTGTTAYYGYLDKDGNWYIMKESPSSGTTITRYAKGTTAYTTAWAGRATTAVTYDYFNVTF
jgi:hypothetical protein